MSDIKAFKLKTGEEFLAEVIEEHDVTFPEGIYKIENPVVPREQMGPEGQPALVFVPWHSISQSRKFTIHRSDLMFAAADADDHLVNNYKQAFGIGVIAPVGPKIITG